MTPKSTSEQSGRHGGEFPSPPPVALASTASAAGAVTVAWSSGRNLATSVLHVSLFPADHCSASRICAATLTPSHVVTRG